MISVSIKKKLNKRADNCYANEINSSYLCSIFKPSLSYTHLSLYPIHILMRHKMARVYIFSSKRIPSVVMYEYGIKEVCIFSPVGKLTDNSFS